MNDFQAFIIFAANVDNVKLTTALRTAMQDEYNVIKGYERLLKDIHWVGNREALKNSWLPNAQRNFIKTCEAVQLQLAVLKPVEPIKEVITQAIFKKPDKTATELRAEVFAKYGTAEQPVIPVSLPVSQVKSDTVITSTIPPSVVAVDAGYLPAIEPEDVQSKTDIAGRPTEEMSNVFVPSLIDIPRIESTEAIYKAAFLPDIHFSRTTALVITAIVLFFVFSR